MNNKLNWNAKLELPRDNIRHEYNTNKAIQPELRPLDSRDYNWIVQ